MKQYYLHYDETANINYSFLFALFAIAERNPKEKIDNIVTYKSLKELIERIKAKCNYSISQATVSRILNDSDYSKYFTKSKEENKIILNSNFRKGSGASNKFVVLTDKETNFLLEQNNKLLSKYYLYLKYYCGYSKSKKIDTTANQILAAIGYSQNCGNNKDALCKYNALLVSKGFIKIDKIRDLRGYYRNIYSMSI